MDKTAQHAAPGLAETLNEACYCRTLDEAALRERLELHAGLGDAARRRAPQPTCRAKNASVRSRASFAAAAS